jgi:hypothetical protein
MCMCKCTFNVSTVRIYNGLINYKDTKTKCRLYWCLIEFIDWRYSQFRLVFSTQLCEYSLFNILSLYFTPTPTLLPVLKYSILYRIQKVCAWDGWGVLSCVGDHILQEFNTLFLTRFRTYKIALTPRKQKPRRGGGLRQINTCRKVPLQVIFFR